MQSILRIIFLMCAVSFLNVAFVFAHDDPDLTHLPLGDNHISTEPKLGWIWACRVDPNGGGAQVNGPWIHGDTYDLTAKTHVQGSASWASQLSVNTIGDRRVITMNGLPHHLTGIFPVRPSDPAYQIDRNPNSISSHSIQLELPLNPSFAAQPSCVPGAVGILFSGAPLFNALDAPGRDAVAHEVQDSCAGHPERSGSYHYHSITNCLQDEKGPTGHSQLLGYALDGFGIYGHYGEGGVTLASADLDECHGHTHAIEWNGKVVNMYHYHATWDFPYTIGCMRGTYRMQDVMGISGGPQHSGGNQGSMQQMGMPPGGMQQGMQGRGPDLSAAAQKLGISEDQLRQALGPPPPDLNATAQKLGISVDALRGALGPPPR